MKIVDVEPVPLAPRWLFVKVTTDEGIVGWGESLGDRALTIAAAITELKRYLVGKDPFQIEHHWQAMYRGAFWRGGPILNAAISGVDTALWDILGKALGAPIWQLMGGKCRDSVRFYRGIGGPSPEALAENALKAVEAGFSAVKWCPVPATPALAGVKGAKAAEREVEAVRKAVGDGVDILLDFHGRLTPAMAIVFAKAVEPYNPMFIEEPVLPEHSEQIPRIAETTGVTIATGERIFTKFGFRPILQAGGVGLIQPDLSICGGLTEGKKIAAMADAYAVGIGPHNPYGPVLTAASLQLDICSPNFVIQEFVSLGEGLFTQPFEQKNGCVGVPYGPGLGIEVDEEAVRAHEYVPHDVPILYNEDGSIADW
ncbi:MAG TPA: galactonate dehydratase [Candidatus Latescibacteria bacterium]|nr:galactonate dehydratase [Candidatus Latescibacterota bacterium]